MATYIVWRDGSTYYAKNEIDGTVHYSGADPTTVLQAVFNDEPGSVLVQDPIALTADVLIKAPIILRGEGVGKTVVSGGRIAVVDVSDVYISDLSLSGTSAIYVEASADDVSGITVERVRATTDATIRGSFWLHMANGHRISNVIFRDCSAIKSGGFGFTTYSDFSAEVKLVNCLLDNCQAIDCGRYGAFSTWVCGIAMTEGISVDGLHHVNCEASGCWECGFYVEPYTTRDICNVSFVNCVARENGQEPSPMFGNGFYISSETRMVSCLSQGNRRKGYLIDKVDFDIELDGCTDIGSAGSFQFGRTTAGHIRCNNCSSMGSAGEALRLYGVNNVTIRNMIIKDPAGDASAQLCVAIGTPNDENSAVTDCDLELIVDAEGNDRTYCIRGAYVSDTKISGRIVTDCANICQIINTDNVLLSSLDITATRSNVANGLNIVNPAGANRMERVQITGKTALNYGVWTSGGYPATVIGPEVRIGASAVMFNNCKFESNGGYSTGTGAQQTIAHGCSFTPTANRVILSERRTGGASAYQSADPDATNIYVTAVSGKDYNWRILP